MITLDIRNEGENLVLLNMKDNSKIILPFSILNDITIIYKEVVPFVDLSFEWLYEYKKYNDIKFTLTMKEDFYNLFLERLKQKKEVIIKNNSNSENMMEEANV